MALLEFYGETCPHCVTMKPLLAKLESETGLKVERYEVWNNEENAKKMAEYDHDNECGGVPYFYNTDTKAHICGSSEYDALKAWAVGNK